MHLSTLQKEKWALIGFLHPYISTATHIFNHHTPTPELSPTLSTVTPSSSTLTILPQPPLYTVPDGGIIWSSNDDSVVILQAPYPTSVTHQFCSDTQRFAVPDLHGVKGKMLSQYHTSDYNLQVNFIMLWLFPRQHIASLPGTWRGAPDSHSLHIHGPPHTGYMIAVMYV